MMRLSHRVKDTAEFADVQEKRRVVVKTVNELHASKGCLDVK